MIIKRLVTALSTCSDILLCVLPLMRGTDLSSLTGAFTEKLIASVNKIARASIGLKQHDELSAHLPFDHHLHEPAQADHQGLLPDIDSLNINGRTRQRLMLCCLNTGTMTIAAKSRISQFWLPVDYKTPSPSQVRS